MHRRPPLTIAAVMGTVFALALLAACSDAADDAAPTTSTTSSTSTSSTTTTTTSTTTTTTTTTLPPDEVAIDALLASLSERDIAQQLVVFGGPGPIEARLTEGAGDVCVGGVFLTDSSENWLPTSSADAARAAITEFRMAAEACPVPPFVSTDAEVGTGVLRVPVAPLPDASTLESNHLAEPATTSVGLAPATIAFASELADLGVDVNFGVVADVDADDGFYMARRNRSFGSDPAVVAAITDALVEGHCAAGVAPTLKHFPNQGATAEDPHISDSFSANDPATWATVGALPYEDTPAPIVMVGHVRYPDIDDGLPATLSPTIIGGWLREQLGYGGVVITDDLLAMRGVGSDLAVADRGLAALRSGADLALFVAADDGATIVDAIVEEMAADPEFDAAARRSAERVLRLKGALGLLADVDPAWFELCPSGE